MGFSEPQTLSGYTLLHFLKSIEALTKLARNYNHQDIFFMIKKGNEI